MKTLKTLSTHLIRLDPRDAFHGSRTNCCKLYHNVKEDEKLFYKNVTTLCPYVQKYGEYPVGIQKIIS